MPVCGKIKYIIPSMVKRTKSCSYKCRNKLETHRKANSLSKKGKPTWNKGITGYTTSWKGGTMSIEGRKKMSKNHLAKTNIVAHMKRYFKSGINKPTKYECIFAKRLKMMNINFKQQVPFLNKYQVDFFIPNKNTIIEIDGVWHYNDKNAVLYDKERDKALSSMGYKLIHIKNKEVNDFDICRKI